MTAYLCQVHGCDYISSADIDGFLVCALHDAPQVRKILDELELPGAFQMDDRPIVMPVMELKEEHLSKKKAPKKAISPWDDPRLADVPDGPSKIIHPRFDLTA